MKNVLALTSLVMIVGYPLAALAQSLGLLPFALISLSTFIGIFVAVNLLAIALASYDRQPNYDGRAARKTIAPKSVLVAEPLPTTWTCNTISA